MIRFVLIRAYTLNHEKEGWSIKDNYYPIVKYPFFETKRDAEVYRAGLYGLTLEEYKRENTPELR